MSPSWLLDFGLAAYDLGVKSADVLPLIQQVAAIATGPYYRAAYERWRTEMTTASVHPPATWIGKLRGRLFLGRSGTSLSGTDVTLHPVYGVPYIPGTTLKGAASAFALRRAGRDALGQLENRLLNSGRRQVGSIDRYDEILFGKADHNAGYLIFHDAWWVPPGTDDPELGDPPKPLDWDIITPHHGDYYARRGAQPPADTDSPVPSPLLTVRGSFLFLVEGAQPWAGWGMQILQAALRQEGLGAARHADHGIFY